MTCSESPPPSPPAVATLWICHALDNNVLRPQACTNTCWRDHLLANAGNKWSSRIHILSIGWHNFLYPRCRFQHSLRLHVICTSLSLGPSHFTHWAFCSCYLLFGFCPPPSTFVTVASWNLCMRLIQILCTQKGQCQNLHVTQLCEMWVRMLCLQVCISVYSREDSRGCWLQTTALYLTSMKLSLHLDETWNSLFSPLKKK